MLKITCIFLILLIPLSLSALPVEDRNDDTGELGFWLPGDDMDYCLGQAKGRAICEDCLKDCQADYDEVYDTAEILQKDNERLERNQKIAQRLIIGLAVAVIVETIILLKR